MEDEIERYFYVNGIELDESVRLDEGVVLEPSSFSASDESIRRISLQSGNEVTLAIAIACLKRCHAQIHISADDWKSLERKIKRIQSWQRVLPVLIGAPVVMYLSSEMPLCSIQKAPDLSTEIKTTLPVPIELIRLSTEMLHELRAKSKRLCELDEENLRIRSAMNIYASYWFNPFLSIQLASIWTGIEVLFPVNRKKREYFRHEIPMFLDEKVSFKVVDELWKERCSSVHEGGIADADSVKKTADLLANIVKQCCEKKLPSE